MTPFKEIFRHEKVKVFACMVQYELLNGPVKLLNIFKG